MPVMVPEGFSWLAAVFGPLWLLARGVWIAAIIALTAGLAIGALAPAELGGALGLLLAWLQGLFGHDLRRWSLERRGFALVQVVAARDEDAAFVRLLDARPDLAPRPG
jgi:hypothetical protein